MAGYVRRHIGCFGLFSIVVACGRAVAQQPTPQAMHCTRRSADSTLALVQSSEAFRFAVKSLAKAEASFGGSISEARIQRLCGNMVRDVPALLEGVVLVHTPALFDLERAYMIFAVLQGQVLAINPGRDGHFRFGLQPSDWNEFLAWADLSPAITAPDTARDYGCLLLSYLENYLPGGLCIGPVDVRVRRMDGGSWEVSFPRFRWKVRVSDEGRIVT